MKTRLSLDDENAYNNVVKDIVDLNLKKQAEENELNELVKEIRKTALISFFFMVENSTLYNHRRTEINIVSSNSESQSQETEDRSNLHFINSQQSSIANIDELQSAIHNTVQQFETEQSSRQSVLTRSSNLAAAALILLRNSSEQFIKCIRANSSRAN